ncbi:MAG: Uma2 family endonuclease [Chloroflexota bacterium]|nr:Uma2 family endonuclease [Chloroflexota bacterium]
MLRDRNDPRRGNRLWQGADLVVEIVSPDNPERDTQVKRRDYVEHGVFRRGDTATSVVLPGFAVAVDTVLDAE